MKIALPVVNNMICMHFGHCQQFAIYNVDKETKAITKEADMTPPPHEPGVLPRWLHELGVNAIIAGGMGQRAQQLFAEKGISVLVGAPTEAPEVLVKMYVEGNLKAGENVCDH